MPPTDFVSRGQALVASGQYQEAVKVCRLGLLGRPTQIDGRLILGQALLALRRYDEVLAEMRVALDLDSHLAAAHGLKGEALLRKGDVHAAREALMRARQLAPGDPSIAALVAETELAISTGGAKLPPAADADPRTKHYPGHKGVGAGLSSTSFTKPGKPDRTGTVELDPDESGVEVIAEEDDDLGDVIDPPTPLDETGELDSVDLVEVPRTEATVAGRPGKKGVRGPDVSAMFPDADKESSGLSRLLGELSGPPGATVAPAPMPLRAPPTGSVPLVDPPAPRPAPRQTGKPPVGKESADMRTIRAGLGLDPDIKLPKPVDAPRKDDSTGTVVPPRIDESALLEMERRGDVKRSERTRKVATDPGGQKLLAKPRRSRVAIALWSIVGVAVIGGGVWGGFKIRAMRLERQVAAARRAADDDAKPDTWKGWRAARDVLDGVVSADGSSENRAAAARARAVLAAEFGDGIDDARAAVTALGDSSLPDAVFAKGELALHDGDGDGVAAAAAALPADSADASYLAGRAALLAGRWDDAITAFGKARDGGGARPAYLVGLARAQAGKRAWPEARAAAELALSENPDHPAAVVEHARILAEAGASGGALADPQAATDAVTALEKVLAEADHPIDEQTSGVSPEQASWAALVLAQLEVARGDDAAARRALDKAKAAAPDDREFAVAEVHLLLALGDVPAAHQEASRAVSAWADSADVHIADAEVALAEGDNARVLAALAPAGDLGGRADALALRGEAHLAQGETDAATTDLDAALALEPDLEPALVARAELDLDAGNPRAAVTRLEKKYGDGASPELSVTYGAALRQVGEKDRARVVLAALTGGGAPRPIAGRAWLETARLERDSGDPAAARAAYAKSIELLPDATGARLEAALLLVDSGDEAGALASLDRLVTDSKDDGKVVVEAARVHVLTGDLDGAKKLLDKAETSSTAPRWQIARERGRVALRERSFPVAIEALERAASLQPDDGETRLLLIDAHLGAQDGASARKVVEDVVKRFAGMPQAQLALGRVRLFSEAYDDAREAFVTAKEQLESAHAAPRAIADATYWLALTTYYGGDAPRARPLAAQAVALDPNLVDAYKLLGDIDAERQQWKSAEKSYQKVTTLDPGNVEVFFDLGEAAVKANDKKAARAALDTYLEKAPQGDLAKDAQKLLSNL